MLDFLLDNVLQRPQSHLIQIIKFVISVPCLLDFIVEVVVVFVETLLAVTLFGDGEGFWFDVELPEGSIVGIGVLGDFSNGCPLS